LLISQVLQETLRVSMLCILLFFSGSCLKTEVFKQLYYSYPKTDTELINGLSIQPEGNPDDNKYKLVVGRALKVASIFYSWNVPARQGDNSGTPINGFGWELRNCS
jgi:hypothetical protein